MTLRIYPVVLELVRDVRGQLPKIRQHDPDLARQLRRAVTSVPLNLAEGMHSRGKNRTTRYHAAMGSVREVLACFEVAEALGYINEIEPDIVNRHRQILGTLVKLVRPK